MFFLVGAGLAVLCWGLCCDVDTVWYETALLTCFMGSKLMNWCLSSFLCHLTPGMWIQAPSHDDYGVSSQQERSLQAGNNSLSCSMSTKLCDQSNLLKTWQKENYNLANWFGTDRKYKQVIPPEQMEKSRVLPLSIAHRASGDSYTNVKEIPIYLNWSIKKYENFSIFSIPCS